jgi:hypothetical protein
LWEIRFDVLLVMKATFIPWVMFCRSLCGARPPGAVVGEGGILMISKEHTLLMLAAEQFPDLTDAEKKLLHAVSAGDVADYSSPNDAENDPQHADTWDASRTIRATVIRWLCVDREAICHIDPRGININAATIDGRLDLAFVIISVPFVLMRCAVKDGVTLIDADTRTLRFSGSVLGASGGTALEASGTHVRGNVFLNQGFRAEGEVRLLGASINGNLECTRGRFYNPGGMALVADRVHVGGDAFLSDRFRAKGAVRVLGASITGDLDCTNGRFYNLGFYAL